MQDMQKEVRVDGRRYVLASASTDVTTPEHPAVFVEVTQAWMCLTCAELMYGSRRMNGFLKKATTEATSKALGRVMRFDMPVDQRCNVCTRKI